MRNHFYLTGRALAGASLLAFVAACGGAGEPNAKQSPEDAAVAGAGEVAGEPADPAVSGAVEAMDAAADDSVEAAEPEADPAGDVPGDVANQAGNAVDDASAVIEDAAADIAAVADKVMNVGADKVANAVTGGVAAAGAAVQNAAASAAEGAAELVDASASGASSPYAAALAELAAKGVVPSAEQGKKDFIVCSSCHSPEAGVIKTGPYLAGIVGRKAGTVPEFAPRYSPGYNESITWTEENLFEYLANPRAFLKAQGQSERSLMAFMMPDPAKRANVIAYLKSLE